MNNKLTRSNNFLLYTNEDGDVKVDVLLEDETIWLTLNQITELFGIDKSGISRHIKNVFETGELDEGATVAKFATVQIEGGRQVTRNLEFYNLDMILSVGYRVNSIRGTQFRIWANRILKDYLLKGYAVNQRMNRIEDGIDVLKSKVDEIDLQIKGQLIPNQGVFFDGQVFDAYELVSKIIRSAKHSIVLIDNYIDESVLTHLTKKEDAVTVTLLTKSISKQLALDVQKANQQYGNFEVRTFTKGHDRFLIIDNTEVYLFGASLKDLGKKLFGFSKMNKNSVVSLLDSIRALNG